MQGVSIVWVFIIFDFNISDMNKLSFLGIIWTLNYEENATKDSWYQASNTMGTRVSLKIRNSDELIKSEACWCLFG